MQYHFKSIDTWLIGICQSHCPEHSWKRSQYQPGKKSIFAEDQANETEDQNAEELADEEVDSQVNDDKKDLPCGLSTLSSSERDSCSSLDKENVNEQDGSQHFTASNTNTSASCHDRVSTDPLSMTATTQSSQRNFYNVDECVSWLLSKISLDIESEFSDTFSDTGELELSSSPQWMEAASSYDHYKDTIPENHSASRTKMELSSPSKIDRNCHCPQCCHIKVNCVHQDYGSHYDSAQYKDENKFGALEDSKENSSSLDCFEFLYTGMNCDRSSIIQCPNNSDSNHSRSKSRRSVSPSKAAKNGKGGLNCVHFVRYCL